jgi:nucleotide-binding universal stress UspA family protein
MWDFAMKSKLGRQKAASPLRPITKAEATSEPGDVIEVVPVLLHLKKILVPYDFSSYSTKALHYALKFAEQFGAAVVALHVVQPVPILPTDVLAAPVVLDPLGDQMPVFETKLREVCRKLAADHHLGITPMVLVGHPSERICETAKDENADLIVIATHGYTGLKRFYMGSTAERVVRHAPCPVLVVREKERDFVPVKKGSKGMSKP